MSFSCADFADSIIETLGVTIPPESADSPVDQANICLEAIAALKDRATPLMFYSRAIISLLGSVDDEDQMEVMLITLEALVVAMATDKSAALASVPLITKHIIDEIEQPRDWNYAR